MDLRNLSIATVKWLPADKDIINLIKVRRAVSYY